MRHTIGAIFLDRNVTAHTDDEAISQFQSLCTALAATIGTGNIVGVAAAILAGGPGAVFWMWVMALLGMMTSYAENVLGICYRRRDAAGRWCGGPMYYLAEGLGGGFGRALAVLFACFCVLASFGMGNMSQINSIAGNLQAVFRVRRWQRASCWPAHRAGHTGRAEAGGRSHGAIVPLMALFYLFGALTVVCVHWAAVPAAFAAIFRGAFGLQAAGGGVLGYGMARAISWGFKRGAFSNEAGLGASVLVHCAANVEEPVQQGMWGMFEVFADTMVVCTLTALVVLTSGLVDLDTGAALTDVEGSALVGQAFSTVFGRSGRSSSRCRSCCLPIPLRWGGAITAPGQWCICWGSVPPQDITGGLRPGAGGAVMKLDLAWALSDTFNGLMMLPNLVGVVGLSGVVVRETQAYLKRK